MEKINTDYKGQIWKIEAKLFIMGKPWLCSFNIEKATFVSLAERNHGHQYVAKNFKSPNEMFPWRASISSRSFINNFIT